MSRIGVRIFIESEVRSMEELELSVGMASDGGWRRGEPRGRTGKVFTTSCWQVESFLDAYEDGENESVVLDRAVNEVLGRVAGHDISLRRTAAEGTSGVLVTVSAEMVPPLIFSPEHIASIAQLGLQLEIDIILATA